MVKKIPLTQGKFAIVDDSDYDYLSKFIWTRGGDYVVTRSTCSGEQQKMHRLIMGAKIGEEIDHINHDKYDNRRSNLRICTRPQNQHNLPIKITNKSGYKGVHFNKQINRWVSQIKQAGKTVHIGSHKNPEDAATAYNFYAFMQNGEFAYLNKAKT